MKSNFYQFSNQMRRRFLFIAILFIFKVATVHGTEHSGTKEHGSFFTSWFNQPTATGNWYGLRNKLEDHGVTISSNFTADILGNPIGGLKQTTEYAGFLDLAIALDFEKIAHLKGLTLTVSNYLASGKDLSAAIGTFYDVQGVYAPGSYYFGEMDLSLSLLDDTVTLEIGRLFAGDVFAMDELWQYYVSGSIDDILMSIPANIFFPAFCIAAWGARATYQTNEQWTFNAGIYNADPDVQKPDNHGADFSFAMDNGCLAIGQVAYKHHQKRADNGLPGNTTFGGYYQSSRFSDLSDPTKQQRGNYGLYLMFDQMIFRGDWPQFRGAYYQRSGASYAEKAKKPYHPVTAIAADRPTGLTLWAAAYLAPQEHINIQTYQIASGSLYQGLLPNRDHDVTAFCFVLGNFSDELKCQGQEIVLEFNHRFQGGQWFYITPDVQYIIDPNGYSDISNILVLGVEISANF